MAIQPEWLPEEQLWQMECAKAGEREVQCKEAHSREEASKVQIEAVIEEVIEMAMPNREELHKEVLVALAQWEYHRGCCQVGDDIRD